MHFLCSVVYCKLTLWKADFFSAYILQHIFTHFVKSFTNIINKCNKKSAYNKRSIFLYSIVKVTLCSTQCFFRPTFNNTILHISYKRFVKVLLIIIVIFILLFIINYYCYLYITIHYLAAINWSPAYSFCFTGCLTAISFGIFEKSKLRCSHKTFSHKKTKTNITQLTSLVKP